MVIGYWVLPILAAIGAAGATKTQRADDDVRRLAESFPIVDAANNLFDAGQGYALRLIRDGGATAEIELSPRYYFERLRPEWTQPDRRPYLSAAAYRSLFDRIDKIKPLGKLLTAGQGAFVTNSRAPFTDIHTLAVVVRANRPSVMAGEPSGVIDARFVYFRAVQGEVEELIGRGADAPLNINASENWRVKIDGRWYWVTQATFETLRVGTVQTVQAAGPTDRPD